MGGGGLTPLVPTPMGKEGRGNGKRGGKKEEKVRKGGERERENNKQFVTFLLTTRVNM